MSQMQFLLPSNFTSRTDVSLIRLLGYDRIPLDVDFEFQKGVLSIERKTRESSYILCPMDVPSLGRFMLQTGFLMNREEPYRLTSELARGEIKKLFQIIHEDESNYEVDPKLMEQANEAMRLLGKSLHESDHQLADELALKSLSIGLDVGERLLLNVTNRKIEESKLQEDAPGCQLGVTLDTHSEIDRIQLFDRSIFHHLSIPISWKEISPTEQTFQWDWLDARIDEAVKLGIPFSVGPIIDFSGFHFPDWIYSCQIDSRKLSQEILGFIEKCVQRYCQEVNSWEIVSRSNSCPIPSFKDEQLLWLTRSALQIANENDPNAEFIVSIDQPWGNYVNWNTRSYSPIAFVDTLVRSDAPTCAINLEIDFAMRGGTYCRTLSEISRRLDEIGTLDMPIRLRLLFPSASSEVTKWGWWRAPFSEELQREWVESVLNICLVKPFIDRITWGSLSDSSSLAGSVFDTATVFDVNQLTSKKVNFQRFPYSGLYDNLGNPKAAVSAFHTARTELLTSRD